MLREQNTLKLGPVRLRVQSQWFSTPIYEKLRPTEF